VTKNQGTAEARAAQGLAALGNRHRLRLFKILVRAGPQGLNISDLQRLLDMPASTLAHHLSMLARAELVLQERHGREVICTANYQVVNGLVAYLKDQCCSGVSRTRESDAA
jgi:DNA-binding transcriptional ArsR family regulator